MGDSSLREVVVCAARSAGEPPEALGGLVPVVATSHVAEPGGRG